HRWNRARLVRVHLEGWKKVRGGTDAPFSYTVEADAFTTTWSLPCGTSARYVAIVPGNDGAAMPACSYDVAEGSIDAVAGLTDDGTALCPDADRDGWVDCACTGATSLCDCADGDAAIHPGAPEA